MTVFDKFASNLWVMTHFFAGLGVVVLFGLNFINRKGSKAHRRMGQVYVLSYFGMIALGLIAGLLHEFYEDRSIKLMLWVQSYFAIVLVVHAAWSAHRRSLSVILDIRLRTAYGLVFPMALFTMIVGLMRLQPVSTCFGLLLLVMTAKIVFLPLSKPRLQNRIYQHASAMGLSGLLLLFNASGFFGVHHVLDRHGEVGWLRCGLSFALFIVCWLIGELYIIRQFGFLKVSGMQGRPAVDT